MQSRQDSPPPSKRPSLLATGQDESNDSQPLLAGLAGAGADKKPKTQTASPAKRSGMWLAALLVLVAGGGAAAWMNSSDNGPERVAAAPAAAPVPPPARPIASVPPAEAADVSTAAILHDTSAAEEKPAPKSAAPVKDSDSSLAAALESKPAAVVAKPAPSHDDAKAARAREHRLAVREREEKQRAEKHPLARKVLAKAADKKVEKKSKAPEADNDSDVALLAALVAHSKNSQAAKPAAESAEARKLRQCKALDSVAEADACRARLCGSAKEGNKSSAACKPAHAAQVVDAS